MEEAYNLITISIEEIIGSLQAYEIDECNPKDKSNKEKSISVQFSSSKASSSKVAEIKYDDLDEEEVEELAMIAKKFKKFL